MSLQLLILCCSSESTIDEVIKSWKPLVDNITVYLNNSVDGTRDILMKHKVTIIDGEFLGFSETRNKLMDLTENDGYDYSIFIDDSYILRTKHGYNKIKKEFLFYKNIDVNLFGYEIGNENCSYTACRIIKSKSKLRYKGAIHESIDVPDLYPYVKLESFYVEDKKTDDQMLRTNRRIYYDIEQLFKEDQNDPRILYYLTTTHLQLCERKECRVETVMEYFMKRLKCETTNYEETFSLCLLMSLFFSRLSIETSKIDEYKGQALLKESIYYLLIASETFKPRAPEAYYLIYQISGNKFYLKKAWDLLNPNFTVPFEARLPLTTGIYTEEIPREYKSIFCRGYNK